MENFTKSLIEIFTHFSSQYGSGVLINDIFVFLLILGVITLLLALSAYRKALALRTPPGLERVNSIAGRVEKLEMTVNEFRIETMRSLELFRGDMGFLKQELAEIRKALKASRSSGGSGGSGSGGQSEDVSGPDSGFVASEIDLAAPAQPIPDLDVFPEAPEDKHRSIENIVDETIPPVTLKNKLNKSRFGFFDRLKSIFGAKAVLSAEQIDELEAHLIGSDMGVKMSSLLIEQLRADIREGRQIDEAGFVGILKEKISEILSRNAVKSAIDPFAATHRGTAPQVVMVVGVNGAGKTTTVAKLAHKFRDQGAKVMLAAADTFRAAAVEQLRSWGERVQVPVVFGAAECKPATVVYDAMVAAKNEGVDVLIIDTAGRLHTKSNLMQELEGVKNAIKRHMPEAPHETILVVDGSTGQNALNQAREFNAATPLSGIVVTKLDGTSKGGIVVAIKDELDLPIRYIGIGEAADDLKPFDVKEFAEALLEQPQELSNKPTSSLSAHAEVRRRRRDENTFNNLH